MQIFFFVPKETLIALYAANDNYISYVKLNVTIRTLKLFHEHFSTRITLMVLIGSNMKYLGSFV